MTSFVVFVLGLFFVFSLLFKWKKIKVWQLHRWLPIMPEKMSLEAQTHRKWAWVLGNPSEFVSGGSPRRDWRTRWLSPAHKSQLDASLFLFCFVCKPYYYFSHTYKVVGDKYWFNIVFVRHVYSIDFFYFFNNKKSKKYDF